jgi:hypothetical protein
MTVESPQPSLKTCTTAPLPITICGRFGTYANSNTLRLRRRFDHNPNLRAEGDLRARSLAEQIERACRATL